MTNSEKLAYLGGYFDGEGSISSITDPMRRQHGWRSCARVQISNTTPVVLEEFQKMFGGGLFVEHPGTYPVRINGPFQRKSLWKWYASGANARRFLCSIFPYLRHEDKRQKAIAALQFDEADGKETPVKKKIEPCFSPNIAPGFGAC